MSAEYLKEWIRKAEEDYVVAIALVRRRKWPTPSAVSFHCQQCAEKYLKAFLVQHEVTWVHLWNCERTCFTWLDKG